ncbi:MAG: 2-oxoacid:acceptor oxidoreductase subunit alpha [Candidatus Altiarchaeota archaeon]
MVPGKKTKVFQEEVSVVICGGAGQGIQTIDYIATRILKLAGFNVFSTKEYESRIRGGSNSTEIRVSSNKVQSYVERIDVLIPLDELAIPHIEKRISKDTIIIGEKEKIQTKLDIVNVPFLTAAKDIGADIFANIIAVGLIAKLFGLKPEILEDYLKKHFSKKGEDIIGKNILAAKKGFELGEKLIEDGVMEVSITSKNEIKEHLLLSGSDAVSLGAMAAGCNFISSYPMSPSTGVLTYLSQKAADFGIIAEQAEDEIAALNMALGATYAGAQAMVTTSGGGFALMEEAVSLSGVMEMPAVIHIAQRPGPATGLPTKTEQADLELALYSGHGEFPRIIFAPGTLEEAFYLTQSAFSLANKFQIPVFVLTDQYFIDSFYNIKNLDPKKTKVERHITKTGKDYRRYEPSQTGVSPRGIPGFGVGLVGADSHEHDEAGHITEDADIRVRMNDKRLKKLKSIEKEIIEPTLFGPKNYKTIVVSWGSTRNVLEEAVSKLNRDDVAALHFSQVYPIHPATKSLLEQASKTIILENNATSQFSRLLKIFTGHEFSHKILKYNGEPFSVEEVISRIKEVLK